MDQTTYGFSAFLAQTDAVGLTVFFILVFMSVASWAVILFKGFRTWSVRASAREVIEGFWSAPSVARAEEQLDSRGDNPFAALALSGISAAAHHQRHQAGRLGDALNLSEFVTRALRQGINSAQARLETGLSLLASVGSTAPFVGLFGTVWGIYHALIGIGVSGQATIDKVAGPVGEALIMTALGIAVAVPAVLGFNALTRANRVILAELDAFAHDLHGFLATGSRVDAAAPAVPARPAAARATQAA
jgi:biopolymer transport protein ExbB